VPRVSELDAARASTSGKIEIEIARDGRDAQVTNDREEPVLEVLPRAGEARDDRPSSRLRRRRGSDTRAGRSRGTTTEAADDIDGGSHVLAARDGRVAGAVASGTSSCSRDSPQRRGSQQGRDRAAGVVPRPGLNPGHWRDEEMAGRRALFSDVELK